MPGDGLAQRLDGSLNDGSRLARAANAVRFQPAHAIKNAVHHVGNAGIADNPHIQPLESVSHLRGDALRRRNRAVEPGADHGKHFRDKPAHRRDAARRAIAHGAGGAPKRVPELRRARLDIRP